ncbi:MAG: HNH endonuclease [Patescibacteria group bacterium]
MKKIKLTKNKYSIISDSDYRKVSQHIWHLSNGYATYQKYDRITKKTQTWYLHWDIIGKPNKGYNVDHINGDRLDNRRSNLRICTAAENMRNRKLNKDNTSGFKGVVFYKVLNKWGSGIKFNGKFHYLGLFITKEEAAEVYNKKAKELHKQFAKLNIITKHKE